MAIPGLFGRGEVWDIDYEEVYDEEGNGVCCEMCGDEMIYRFGQFVCNGCGHVMTRSELEESVGGEIHTG